MTHQTGQPAIAVSHLVYIPLYDIIFYIKVIFNAIAIVCCRLVYTMSTKKFPVWFLAISQLLLGQIKKVRSVLKTDGPDYFKTVLTFVIWPSRS